MTDIVERLRKDARLSDGDEAVMLNAADEIERLREALQEVLRWVAEGDKEIERLREALNNIADKTVCPYAKITATVALINWQEPAALHKKETE